MYVSSDENEVCIKVIDTGIGLSADDVSHIFDRFYQAENGKQVAGANPGTGLGLALSKNIIHLHHGDIAVQSQVGYGTIFTVTLLRGNVHFENDKNAILLESPDEPMIKEESLPDSISSEEYEEMEMCMKIKNNIDLCHIPVVLLTALDSVEYNIEGLQQGADDYISKPFHAKVLLMRCNNLIRNRLLLKSQLTKQVDFDVQLLATTSLDQQLLNRIVEIVDQRMGEPDFDVNALARELNMGRSSFFTKVKNLTGMTPSEFMQNQRINRAATLLREQPDLLVNEISDRLGFSSTVYFSRCFKAKFGVSPAQFRKKEQ